MNWTNEELRSMYNEAMEKIDTLKEELDSKWLKVDCEETLNEVLISTSENTRDSYRYDVVQLNNNICELLKLIEEVKTFHKEED